MNMHNQNDNVWNAKQTDFLSFSPKNEQHFLYKMIQPCIGRLDIVIHIFFLQV